MQEAALIQGEKREEKNRRGGESSGEEEKYSCSVLVRAWVFAYYKEGATDATFLYFTHGLIG